MNAFQLTTTANLSVAGHPPECGDLRHPERHPRAHPGRQTGHDHATVASTSTTVTTSTSSTRRHRARRRLRRPRRSRPTTTTARADDHGPGDAVTQGVAQRFGHECDNCARRTCSPPSARFCRTGPPTGDRSRSRANASPAPHLGQPITLSTRASPSWFRPTCLLKGYEAVVLTRRSADPVDARPDDHGLEHDREDAHVHHVTRTRRSSIHDPDGRPEQRRRDRRPAGFVTSALPNTTWHPVNATPNVVFTEKSAIIKASLIRLAVRSRDGTRSRRSAGVTTEQLRGRRCDRFGDHHDNVAPSQAVTTTTVAAGAAGTLPRTGASVVVWLIFAAIALDAGIVLLVGTKRRASHLFNRN